MQTLVFVLVVMAPAAIALVQTLFMYVFFSSPIHSEKNVSVIVTLMMGAILFGFHEASAPFLWCSMVAGWFMGALLWRFGAYDWRYKSKAK